MSEGLGEKSSGLSFILSPMSSIVDGLTQHTCSIDGLYFAGDPRLHYWYKHFRDEADPTSIRFGDYLSERISRRAGLVARKLNTEVGSA